MRSCTGAAGLVALLVGGLPLQAREQASPVAPQDRLLVLPIEFAYYKYQSTGPIEVIPDRTEFARRNLEDSLQRALKRDESQQFVAMPGLSAEELAIVNEYTDFLRLLAAASTAAILERSYGSSYYSIGSGLYSIGSGLAFLAERSGVDRAIFVSGIRAEPSLDVAVVALFMHHDSLYETVGNKKVLSALVVDLRSGDVLQNIVPERGFAGEPDEVAGANTWMSALFDIAPDRARHKTIGNGSPRPERLVRHPRPRKGFVITSPLGWGESDDFHTLCLFRHKPGIESICVDNKVLVDGLLAKGLTPDADPMKVGEVATNIIKTDGRFADMEVISLTSARIAGGNGFRAELASRLNVGGSLIRERHVIYGLSGAQGAYLLRLDAPAIYYFDHYLPEFETMVGTFKLMN